jgi:WhiB family redox-sensing transcriptional regulator
MTWHKHAACIGTDPNIFFPVRGDTPTVKVAKAICKGCPVRIKCLTDAMQTGEKYGIRGGFTAQERREMKRKYRLERMVG